jgi:glycosyltransferase involved in cell wall biosynthesis
LALRATRRARAIIAVSEYTRQDTIRHLRYPQDRVFVTHEAAAPGMSPAPPEAIAALRRRYDLPERFVLHLGNTDRRKGAHRLLGAFAGWRDAGGRKDTSLVIAGPHHEPDGKLFLDLPSLARSLGVEESVRFLGPIPEEEKAALYSAATVFALLSEYEGFGLPPLECMACGTPVMVAATTSLPEVVGEAGLLVELADEQGIAAALGRLLEDDAWRAELRQRGLEHAGRFSWARTARETMAVYERVLSTPSHEKLPSPGS